ncbi:unnamed protein product [Prunus armeniaca]
MKDLGGLKYFLGIEVARSQQDTPIVQNHHLGEYPDQVPTNKERYQWLVGRLIHLSHTQPYIAYAVSVVSQFMHSPSKDHMNAVLRILRYLKSALGKGLMFSKHGHLNIDGYSDADWTGNVTDRKSTSGYFTFVRGNLVTWRSKKQNVVALSSPEAEFRGMTKGICELLWLRKLLTELGYKPTSTMNLFNDNKAAIAIAQNPKLEAKVFQFPFVKSEDQLADILTKAISSKVFHNSLDQLGIGDIYAPTLVGSLQWAEGGHEVDEESEEDDTEFFDSVYEQVIDAEDVEVDDTMGVDDYIPHKIGNLTVFLTKRLFKSTHINGRDHE